MAEPVLLLKNPLPPAPSGFDGGAASARAPVRARFRGMARTCLRILRYALIALFAGIGVLAVVSGLDATSFMIAFAAMIICVRIFLIGKESLENEQERSFPFWEEGPETEFDIPDTIKVYHPFYDAGGEYSGTDLHDCHRFPS